jgi:hypothetical protein
LVRRFSHPKRFGDDRWYKLRFSDGREGDEVDAVWKMLREIGGDLLAQPIGYKLFTTGQF